MKELEEFTVERLEEIHKALKEGLKLGFADALILRDVVKIALAAKQAQIVAWEVKGILCHTKEEASIYVGDPEPLYDAPPLNHTEHHLDMVVPDGWKLVPIEPTQSMVDACVEGVGEGGFQRGYRKMLAATPKPESE